MNYYQFHIGDYASHTRHLSDYEDLAYRRLLDWYYLHEKPIPLDPKIAARIISLSDRSTDVEQVLNEFFTRTESGWINSRADEEIASFHCKKKAASEAGKASAKSRMSKENSSLPLSLDGRSTGVQPTKNQEPRTINHKPDRKNISAFAPPIPVELLADWLEVRKAKKAGKLTPTAWQGIEREAEKAGISAEQAVRICCERGWQGFKAEWIKEQPPLGARLQHPPKDDFKSKNYGTGVQDL